jgi:hypothetical protein
MVKKMAQNAGFNEGTFSFHSLRAGFLCNAYIKTSRLRQQYNNINVQFITAIIANWVPNSRAQLRYLKDLFRANISATRLGQLCMLIVFCNLFLLNCFLVETELIPFELLEPESFYRLKGPLVNLWVNENVTNQFVNHKIAKAIAHPQQEVIAPEVKKVYKKIFFWINYN